MIHQILQQTTGHSVEKVHIILVIIYIKYLKINK